MKPTKRKILRHNQARDLIRQWKAEGNKIVFTNGCFDMLHPGHVHYLEQASTLGDRLVVGVNADASVRKLKGDGRPVYDEDVRAGMLAALGFVDAVVKFEELTPLKLIELLLPDVLVKGDDYNPGNIIGADVVLENGGRVETIALTAGYSTTGLIEKLRRLK